ncbi:MAG: hypothetical protein U1E17_04720 [Geminicoccaceae bacterium]
MRSEQPAALAVIELCKLAGLPAGSALAPAGVPIQALSERARAWPLPG